MKISIHQKNFLPHADCSIDLELNEGAILLIQGENGAGKTSLAREIFQQNTKDMSFVRQEGLDLFYDRPLGQIKKLFKDSASEILDNDLFEKYWNAFELSKKHDRLQSSLSGGEEQMLKICLGSCLKKNFIILDEPSQNLDSDKKLILKQLVDELMMMKKSLLIIDHDDKWIGSPFTRAKLSVINRELKVEGIWNI